MPILKDAMLNQGSLAQLEKRVKAWALRNQDESGCIVVRGTASPNDAVCDTVLASGALDFTRIPSLSLKVGGIGLASVPAGRLRSLKPPTK